MGLRIIASAPARCGIAGNPSDIYGGKVLSCSVPARATCTLESSDTYVFPEDRTLWDAATARLPVDAPVRVTWHSDVPRSSGLAGSTALLTATVRCLLAWRGESATPTELAELVRDIERNEANIVCGYQDAYMSSFGGLNLMSFEGKHPTVPGPSATVQAIDAPLPFLLVTTGVERLSGSVHGPIAERWLQGDRKVRGHIERITELAPLAASALIGRDMATLADAMNENQALIRDLGGSGDAIDQLIEAACSAGAAAAKLAGAGMGGTIIALTEDAEELEHRLRSRGYLRFMRPQIAAGARIESVSDTAA